ncbi:hypothetical protein QQ020_35650 [Fulvivirgaceae bacterium BMA12]|uniref:Uncharacterized protein n=1 Tax=Agaribacillus aureus TaxID=3051825 RepID=A0ABT8LI65_9BACT|nr:hypothetical protein [Fulvivirgaceae bacterium BMA12]
MKKIGISMLFLILCSICYAQNGFEPGFIITLSGDTVHGVLRDRKEATFLKLYKKVRFKPEGKNATKKYNANQIRAYAIGDQMFESVNENALHQDIVLFNRRLPSNNSNDRVFLKVIVNGVASYYQKEWVDQDSGVLEVVDYIKKAHNPKFVRATQGILGLKKRKLSAYFSDCPPLQLKIKNKDIVTSLEVVRFYNNWILNDRDNKLYKNN